MVTGEAPNGGRCLAEREADVGCADLGPASLHGARPRRGGPKGQGRRAETPGRGSGLLFMLPPHGRRPETGSSTSSVAVGGCRATRPAGTPLWLGPSYGTSGPSRTPASECR